MAKSRATLLLLTCEHGGNQVPSQYRRLFTAHHELLESHRGWDPGTKQLALRWHEQVESELVIATVTRLLVDLNRSPNHPQAFSEITRDLQEAEKLQLLARYHAPHRTQVTEQVRIAINRGRRVLHIGIHSFTPILNGQVRNAEIGLLYDPRRKWELEICRRWRDALRSMSVQPRVRMNYPYRGTSDGLTTSLRKSFDANMYAGIELEINQQLPLAGGRIWGRFQSELITTTDMLLG
jgi:predicted N-formylglutamate amidohydrolase